MYFLREQLFWSLWLLISVAAALCFHGCWLISVVADLLDSLILSRTENQKNNIFLSKFSPQVKLFAILIIHILLPLKDLSKAFALYDKWQMRNEKWQS